jgi:hypothetical protein
MWLHVLLMVIAMVLLMGIEREVFALAAVVVLALLFARMFSKRKVRVSVQAFEPPAGIPLADMLAQMEPQESSQGHTDGKESR